MCKLHYLHNHYSITIVNVNQNYKLILTVKLTILYKYRTHADKTASVEKSGNRRLPERPRFAKPPRCQKIYGSANQGKHTGNRRAKQIKYGSWPQTGTSSPRFSLFCNSRRAGRTVPGDGRAKRLRNKAHRQIRSRILDKRGRVQRL